MYVEKHQMMHRTPDPPPPDPCMHFFSKLVTSHASLSCIIEEKILLTAGLATQSLKLSFIDKC